MELFEAEYNQVERQFLDSSSELYQTDANFIIVFQSTHKLEEKHSLLPTDQQETLAEERLAFIASICENPVFVNQKIICLNYPEIEDTVFGSYANKVNSSFTFQVRKLNYELMRLSQQYQNLFICDIAGLQNKLGRDVMFASNVYVSTEMVLSIDALPFVASRVVDIICAIKGQFKKCLILDLDNTVWGGVIGDDGLEGIQLGHGLGIGKAFTEFQMWVKYGERIREEWQLSSRIKPGFRALFYGPSGCGKTFTATLLGKEVGKQVFCIDLSMVVSKYIGETEKNLAKVFELAENKDWILFFDEADALFGKRTNVKDSHDRYANQEVAYLLQRVEDYKGLVILSTNLKSNIDEAFARRFQIMVRFNMPNAQERERLWISSFSPLCKLEETIDIKQIAENYELAGGSIINVVQYCSISAMSREENIIRKADLLEGIRNEFSKVGKTIRE